MVLLLSAWEISVGSLSRGQTAEAPPPLAPTEGIEASRLAVGPAVERPLAGGETHAHLLALSAGQYVHVVVNQLGIDATLCFFDPRGNPLGNSTVRMEAGFGRADAGGFSRVRGARSGG